MNLLMTFTCIIFSWVVCMSGKDMHGSVNKCSYGEQQNGTIVMFVDRVHRFGAY